MLDSAVPLPGSGRRVGLDPIIGLIPVVGDLVTGLVTAYLVTRTLQFRLPRIVAVRMLVNTVIDVAVGAIPFVGDLFDFAWRANQRNIDLFERHASAPGRATRDSWLFVVALIGALVALIVLAAWLVIELLSAIVRALGG